jgi:hypothetical protein
LPDQQRVEALHEFRGGSIFHVPETGGDSGGSGVKEPARESNQAFAANLLADRGTAAAEHHQVCIEIEIVDLVEAN